MNDIVIKIDNLTKEYKLNKKEKFITLLKNMIKGDKYLTKRVLNNLSFEVKKGEKIAFIGKNGSGKSTILKLISGVSYPTSGILEVNGKVNALLELNSGFEQEFTGRENIYLKGTLMGLSDSEIKKVEKKIIDFADIGDYIDYPICKYSTGMKARLGFAIAVSIDPEILVIDEALSVGDEEFKNKCLKKITSMTKAKNVTLLLVTHSSEMAKQFCERGIVLETGNITFDGEINEAVEYYHRTLKGIKN